MSNAAHYATDRYALTAANGGIAPTEAHGYSTYNNWRCRCDTCVTSHQAWTVEYRNRARHDPHNNGDVTPLPTPGTPQLEQDAPSPPCATTDPEVWFPEIRHAGPDRYFHALMGCRTCPFTAARLEIALAAEGDVQAKMRFGMYGGKTPSERSAIARDRREATA